MAFGNRAYGGGNGYVAPAAGPLTIALPLLDGGVIYGPTRSATVTKTLPLIDGGSILAPIVTSGRIVSLSIISDGAVYGPASVIVDKAIALPMLDGGNIYTPIIGPKTIFLPLVSSGSIFGPTADTPNAQSILLPLLSDSTVYAPGATIPFMELILGANPSAMWIMNETSGTTFADSSGHGRDLTIVGSPTLGTSIVMASGQADPVWDPELEGGDYGYLTSGDSSAWWPSTNYFGFLCWFCGSSTNETNQSDETLYDFNGMVKIAIVNTSPTLETGTLHVWYANEEITNTIESQNGVNLLDGLPHQIWVESRSGEITLYVDGFAGETAISGGWDSLGGSSWPVHVGIDGDEDVDHGLNNPMGYVGVWVNTTLPDIEDVLTWLAVSRGALVELEFTGHSDVNLDRNKLIINRHLVGSLSGEAAVLEEPQFFEIERSQVWWSQNYTYRRNILIEATPAGLEENHPLTTYLSSKLITQGKVQRDGSDIEVLRLASFVPERWEVLNSYVEVRDQDIKIVWANGYEIPPGEIVTGVYYIYYGNHTLDGAPEPFDTPYVPSDWPLEIAYSHESIDYTRPGEHWIDNVATEYQAKATFNFYGDRVRILADTGLDWGIAEVQIDDGPWERADLFSNPPTSNAVVFSKENLSKATHTLRYRLSGDRNASASDIKINLTKIQFAKWGVGVDMGEEADETLLWSSAIGGTIGG